MLEWNKDQDGEILPGLVRRRREERAMFLRKPPPPPVRYTEKEKEWLDWLKTGNKRQKELAEQWLRHQAREIQKEARARKGGWKVRDRARRYQGIRRALRRYVP